MIFCWCVYSQRKQRSSAKLVSILSFFSAELGVAPPRASSIAAATAPKATAIAPPLSKLSTAGARARAPAGVGTGGGAGAGAGVGVEKKLAGAVGTRVRAEAEAGAGGSGGGSRWGEEGGNGGCHAALPVCRRRYQV